MSGVFSTRRAVVSLIPHSREDSGAQVLRMVGWSTNGERLRGASFAGAYSGRPTVSYALGYISIATLGLLVREAEGLTLGADVTDV